MGETQNDELRFGFDSRLKLRSCGSKVTSDAGLLAYRELVEALELTQMGEEVLTDSRLDASKQHLFVPLLRQSIYSRLAGYEDVSDAERLCIDPAARPRTTRRVCNYSRWSTTWRTSCGGWLCRGRLIAGRSPHCVRSW